MSLLLLLFSCHWKLKMMTNLNVLCLKLTMYWKPIFLSLSNSYLFINDILIQWKLLSTKNQLFKKWMLIVDRWKQFHKHLPPPICDMKNVNHLKQLYNKATINNCLANVQIVGHNEKTDCFGLLQVRWQGASMYIVYI